MNFGEYGHGKKSEVYFALDDLFQRDGGLFESVEYMPKALGEPTTVTRMARLGDVSTLCYRPERAPGARRGRAVMGSAGTAMDDHDAVFLALAEGLERYCASVWSAADCLWSTARDLGDAALDLDTIPRCSPTELAHPSCPLVAPSKTERIRWVRGISLLSGCSVFVPAVMTYLGNYEADAERFWLPISTGCAAHRSYEGAVLNALLEVVERDAISIVWLQRLPLARIEIDIVPAVLSSSWACYQRSSADLEYLFFDATMDTGIPTVYGVQIAHEDTRLRTLVACSTHLDPAASVAKTIRDLSSIRLAMRDLLPIPAAPEDFTEIRHGATFMARAEQSSAFSFLVESSNRVNLSEMSGVAEPTLIGVLDIFRRANLDVYAVDITTDEGKRANWRVVRVLVPGLQPLSFNYRARYLGHPRLYNGQWKAGYHVMNEEQLNSSPQPFL